MIGSGKPNTVKKAELLRKVSEGEVANYYFGITKIPCLISSPLRSDMHPSMGLYSVDGQHIYYKDYATGEHGSLIDLVSNYLDLSFKDTLLRINKDITSHSYHIPINKPVAVQINASNQSSTTLDVVTRDWNQADLDYWGQFGITKEWLQWADVYPISKKIFSSAKGKQMIFGTDKLAYAYVEKKEGKISIKVYQPLNKNGYKWTNKHDGSVISLWTKIPEKGDRVVICSSLKDALCLSANTFIPALAIQGEGMSMSETAIMELKRRFKNQYILLDNDETGLKDAVKLQERTGFINITLPAIQGNDIVPRVKDIAEAYQVLGKESFINLMSNLFNIT